MTQENKELLLKDLCARLPYKVKASYYGAEEEREIWDEIEGVTLDGYVDVGQYSLPIESVKPYLFPFSSITEEQKEELKTLGWNFDNSEIHNVSEFLGTYREYVSHLDCFILIGWLNKNNIDYRGLIEKGLAIDATNTNIYDATNTNIYDNY